jgi:hypothetical protein
MKNVEELAFNVSHGCLTLFKPRVSGQTGDQSAPALGRVTTIMAGLAIKKFDRLCGQGHAMAWGRAAGSHQ